jgi:hypothetical protein
MLYHKDSEQFATDYSAASFQSTAIKKKENTRIKYIVNKIDKVSEINSEVIKNNPSALSETNKNYYVPLLSRKAILYNNTEIIKILQKVQNVGKKSLDNSSYYDELQTYKKYPYINYKEFKQDGFSIVCSKTIDVIRYSTFEIKQSKNNSIQWRVGSAEQTINIVGFIISPGSKSIKCLKIKNIDSVANYKNIMNNGYEFVLKFLAETSYQKIDLYLYWLFNINTDKKNMFSYEQFKKFNKQEQIRYLICQLYDDIIIDIYNKLIDHIKQSDNLSLYSSYKLFDYYSKNYLELNKSHALYDKFEDTVYYEKSIRVKPSYDKKSDIFYGIDGTVIKLPTIHKDSSHKNKFKRLRVIAQTNTNTLKTRLSPSSDFDQNQELESGQIGVCQHTLTWQEINNVKKTDINKYNILLYEFTNKYLTENADKDYICKSCNILLDIKKFITDGTYDEETGKYIAMSIEQGNLSLEKMSSYEKFTITIHNMDKLLEKIATISNLSLYTGVSNSVRLKRQSLIKDLIDLILVHTQAAKDNFKERNIQAVKSYGISSALTNMYLFDLEDSIFIYTGKDVDVYKKIKYNNIIAYMCILIVLDISPTHIVLMTNDAKSMCSYEMFEKYHSYLFEGLKIRKNIQGDTTEVVRYKILSYILYIISCVITKYKIWYYEYKDQPNKADKTDKAPSGTAINKLTKGKFDPRVQKMIIHTIVDLLNSILEINTKFHTNNQIFNTDKSTVNKIRIYDILATKFFIKMRDFYSNKSILDNMIAERDLTLITNKEFIPSENIIKSIPLTGSILDQELTSHITLSKKTSESKYDHGACFFPDSRESVKQNMHITNTTNCPDGKFHIWKVSNKYLKCELCSELIIDDTLDKANSKKISKLYKYNVLQNMAKQKCITGKLHIFVNDTKTNTRICSICKKSSSYQYSQTELDQLEHNVTKLNSIHSFITEPDFETEPNSLTNQEHTNHILHTLNKHYFRDNPLAKSSSKYNDKFSYLDQFINNINILTGNINTLNASSANISVTTNNILIKDNMYVIDHDHNGNILTSPIIIYDNENKIHYQTNHPIYKTNVLYYINYKYGKIETYYDAITRLLLGFRENNKEYIFNKKNNRKITITYSFYHKLKLLGYASEFTRTDNLTLENLQSINRNRLNNIKKIINTFKTMLYRLTNKYSPKAENNLQPNIANSANSSNKFPSYEPELTIIQQIFNKYL